MASPALDTEQPNSPLHSLSGELLNDIYRYTLVEPQPILTNPHDPLPSEPGLLQTCKRVREEARPI